jgi:multiple sugar transport system substrate-binding protein
MGTGFAKAAGLVSLLAVMGGLSGCPSGGSQATGVGGAKSGKVTLQFWHTRRGSQEKALEALCDEFERNQPGIDVVPQYQGGYGDLIKKIRASIIAKSLPAMTVAYEDNVTEYAKNGVVLPLDPLLKDPSLGLTDAELADIPAPYLETDRSSQSASPLLSFPFTKSNLVLYYNKTLMAKAGLKAPPATWAELERQAAVITAQTGKPALSFASDASTLDGMIYSFGGEIVDADGRRTLFDQPPMVKTLELLQRMAKARTLAEATGDDAVSMFGSQLSAFTMNSSAGRAAMEEQIKDAFEWDLTVIPHAEGVKPVTVMYGPNICIFKSTPEVETAAWRFVKYFVSPETTARWARETGYLPVRKSAAESPEMVEFYRKNPRAAHVYEVLQYARGEPNLLGWQEVRAELEKTASNVVGSGTSPATAAVELKKTADRILAQSK